MEGVKILRIFSLKRMFKNCLMKQKNFFYVHLINIEVGANFRNLANSFIRNDICEINKIYYTE